MSSEKQAADARATVTRNMEKVVYLELTNIFLKVGSAAEYCCLHTLCDKHENNEVQRQVEATLKEKGYTVVDAGSQIDVSWSK